MSRKGNTKTEMFHPTTECVDSLTINDVAGQAVPESVRSPIVASRTLGTFSRCVRADRSRWLLGMSATQIRSSARYCSTNPCNDLKINIASLNCMHSDAHSQWRLASVSVMWSERRRPATHVPHLLVNRCGIADGPLRTRDLWTFCSCLILVDRE